MILLILRYNSYSRFNVVLRAKERSTMQGILNLCPIRSNDKRYEKLITIQIVFSYIIF